MQTARREITHGTQSLWWERGNTVSTDARNRILGGIRSECLTNTDTTLALTAVLLSIRLMIPYWFQLSRVERDVTSCCGNDDAEHARFHQTEHDSRAAIRPTNVCCARLPTYPFIVSRPGASLSLDGQTSAVFYVTAT